MVGSLYEELHDPSLQVFPCLIPLSVRGLHLVTGFTRIEYGKGDRLSFPRLDCKTVTLVSLTLSPSLTCAVEAGCLVASCSMESSTWQGTEGG